MAKKGQKFKRYSNEFRTKVINERLEHGYTKRFLSKKYEIPLGTINTWFYQYEHNGLTTKRKRGRSKQTNETNYKEKYEILKKFLESLEEVEQEKK